MALKELTLAQQLEQAYQFTPDVYEKLEEGDKWRLLMRLQSLWQACANSQHTCDKDAKETTLIVTHMYEKAKTLQAPFIKIVSDAFLDGLDLFELGRSGCPRVIECVLTFADTLFDLFQSILHEFGFPVSLQGLAELDSVILFWVKHQHPDVLMAFSQLWKTLFFGSQSVYQELGQDVRRVATIIRSSGSSPAVPLVQTSQSYLAHIALLPLERRKMSFPRTIAFVEALVHQKLGQVKDNKRVIWVLGASDGVEGLLAREGWFEDAGAFVEGRSMEIYLIGDDLTSAKIWPVQKQTGSVTVHIHFWDDYLSGRLPDYDLAFCFNTGLGTLDPIVVEAWLPRLVDLLLYPNSKNGAVVLTCRCQSEVRGEKAILARLGARGFLPSQHQDHFRNLYSGMAANLYVEYDDNGWCILLQGSEKKKQDVLAMINDPEPFLAAVRDEVNAIEESTKQEKAEASEPSLPMTSEQPASEPSLPKISKQKDSNGPVQRRQSKNGDVKSTKQGAVFWGILDLKYDPTKGLVDRVKVLETGDGRASKFSGYGAAIKESFQQNSKLESALHRKVLVESKKLTWDMVCERGYAHIQPRQGCFPKTYRPELAGEIALLLGLRNDDVCVLKLANRARGAGVIPIRLPDLDDALNILLRPPDDIDAWLKKRDPQWIGAVTWGSFEEQVRHWWSNEYPAFLVEKLCTSRAEKIQSGDECLYLDGTMRVGFSLHKDTPEGLPAGYIHAGDSGIKRIDPENGMEISVLRPSQMNSSDIIAELWKTIRPFSHLFPVGPRELRVKWLGAYWKLPMEDVRSPDLRGRIVSVAKHGTAPVSLPDLHEVYASLGDAVSQIFAANHETGHSQLFQRYKQFPELGAAVIARLASSVRNQHRAKSEQIFNLAQSKLQELNGRPCDLVNAYILRNLGIHEAQTGNWSEAASFFKKSLQVMPTNANSRYLLGMCFLEAGEVEDAIKVLEGSLQLDPDFRAPYIGIGVASLRLYDYETAAEVSEWGLSRFPKNTCALYNLGVANFGLAHKFEKRFGAQSPEAAQMRIKAIQALRAAKEQASNNAWTEKDKRMVASLKDKTKVIGWSSSELPNDGWRVYDWRP